MNEEPAVDDYWRRDDGAPGPPRAKVESDEGPPQADGAPILSAAILGAAGHADDEADTPPEMADDGGMATPQRNEPGPMNRELLASQRPDLWCCRPRGLVTSIPEGPGVDPLGL